MLIRQGSYDLRLRKPGTGVTEWTGLRGQATSARPGSGLTPQAVRLPPSCNPTPLPGTPPVGLSGPEEQLGCPRGIRPGFQRSCWLNTRPSGLM